MEKKFSEIEENGARSRKGKDGHVVDNYQLPSEKGGHKQIEHKGKVFTSSGKTGTDIRNRNAPAHHYVTKEKIDDKKSKYHGQEVEKGIWVNQIGRVIEEMKKFSEVISETLTPEQKEKAYKSRIRRKREARSTIAKANFLKKKKRLSEDEQLDEDTIHLAPHGNTGQHYKVVKGVHTLKKGDVLHDSEVDDLRDHYKIKHVKG